MCHHLRCLLVCFVIFAIVNTESDFGEDIPPYTYSFSNPSALNFRDIYTSMVTSAEEKHTDIDDDILISTTTEEVYLLRKSKGQFVEFVPDYTTTSITPPPPKYLLNSTFAETKPLRARKKHVTNEPTTEEYDDVIKVVPKDLQRGVLDLLFPESRVRTFRNIFNTIKRMLSHTFRR